MATKWADAAFQVAGQKAYAPLYACSRAMVHLVTRRVTAQLPLLPVGMIWS
jgi:hypothetical protein